MAKAENPYGITGKLHSMIISKTKDGYIVRSTRGWISKSKIKNNPRYSKIKETNEEFGRASTDGKLIRNAITSSIYSLRDYRLSSRITQCIFKILEHDKCNPRGKRTVSEGLKSPEGKLIMKSLNFNIDAQLGHTLMSQWTIDKATHVINIPNIIPTKSLKYPKDATHFSISAVAGVIDFTNRTFDLLPTNEVSSRIVSKVVPVILTPKSIPTGSGFTFFILRVGFFKMMNNVQHPINNGIHDALSVIEVM
jgi:hypothetical protein